MLRLPISEAVIDTYRREGAARIDGAFVGWVPRLLAAHDRLQARLEAAAVAGATGRAAKIAHADGFPPLTYNHNHAGQFGIRNAVFFDDDFRDWMLNSPAADIVGQVIGARTLQFWWDQSFCKAANSMPEAATQWHTDAGSFSFVGEMLPSFWIAATDVGPDNAPLITVAGSHNDRRMFRPVFGKEHVKVLPPPYAELSELENIAKAPGAVIRTWTMAAGDCLVIHPRTYHASLAPVPGAGRRIGLTSRWLGDDIRWQLREMTFTYPDDKRFRNIVQDAPPPEAEFPIIWRRSSEAA